MDSNFWAIEANKYVISEDIRTENNDYAYKTTNSFCLDAFVGFVCGIKQDTMERLVSNAYNENPELTLKIIMYTYASRIGKDEREIGIKLINWICNKNEKYNYCVHLIKEIPVLGRYKDLINFCDNSNNIISEYGVTFFTEDLLKCKYSIMMNNKEGINLSPKWAPSEKSEKRRLKNKENCGNNVAEMIAQKLRPNLKLESALKNYRKMVGYCRGSEGLQIAERYMTEHKKIPKYESLPAGFILKHAHSKKAGPNKGGECWLTKQDGWSEHLLNVSMGTAKVNTQGGKQSLVDLVSVYLGTGGNSYNYDCNINTMCGESVIIEAAITDIFEKIKKNIINKRGKLDNWLVSPDYSGSMLMGSGLPFKVACTFALIFSHMNENEHYKDLVIAFSDKPFLVKLQGHSWYDRLKDMITKLSANIGYSTNFDSVVDKVVEISQIANAKPPKIMLVSDMQTNEADLNYRKETFIERTKRKYRDLYINLNLSTDEAYDDFQMMLVNVNGKYDVKATLDSEGGVAYVAGVKQTVVEDIMEQGRIDTPYESMMKCLKPFDRFSVNPDIHKY